MDRECAYCWKLFAASRARKKYCSQDCYHKGRVVYRPCEYCWKMFNPRKKTTQFCSEKCYWLSKRSLPEVDCPICWKTFHKTKKTQKYCSHLCAGEAARLYKKCEWCWKKYNPERNTQKYCSYKCSAKARAWIYRKNMDDESRNERLNRLSKISSNLISKINIQYAERLKQEWYDIKLEYRIWKYQYDIKVGDKILIEINPWVYHNSTRSPTWSPKEKMYHYNKVRNAISNWYKCIIARDRTSDEELFRMINEDISYGDVPILHWYNPKTLSHIIDNKHNKDDMIKEWYVEIYDAWQLI